MRPTLTVLALAAVVGPAGTVGAEESAALGRCSPGTAERLGFIEERLEQRKSYATWWWRGWTAFYGIGTIVESVEAGTEDDRGKRADYAVSAIKAGFGVGRLLFDPITAKQGADPMRAVDPVDESACRERLRVGEELLRTNARESESRWSWKRHAVSVAINVAAGLIVAEGFDESRGWRSAGIGIAVGETFTFSHPWKADDDLAEYERRFESSGVPAVKPVSWSVDPHLGGVRLRLSF